MGRRDQHWGVGWHFLTAAAAGFAIVLQLGLVLAGDTPLDEARAPATYTAVVRLFSYFAILANLLVAFSAATLAAHLDQDVRWWRVLRLNAVIGITVTAVVHWLFPRPLHDLAGADLVADRLLHVVVPALAVVGWVAFGPRARIGESDLVPSLVFPLLFLVWTAVHGLATGWYPYSFIDVEALGFAQAGVNALGVLGLLTALTLGARRLDLWLVTRQRARTPSGRR